MGTRGVLSHPSRSPQVTSTMLNSEKAFHVYLWVKWIPAHISNSPCFRDVLENVTLLIYRVSRPFFWSESTALTQLS